MPDDITTETADPADAFKRAKPETAPPIDAKPARQRNRATRAARETPRDPIVVEQKDAIDPDDVMTAEEAAEELVGMMDNVFAICVMIRGYDRLIVESPDGSKQPMLPMLAPDEKKKARLIKAVARVAKGNGVSMSPGLALGLAGFGCYGGPILAMEYALYAGKKAAPK